MTTPVCFMIMPFRTKKTGADPGRPAEIDFDALWERAILPAIEELGYDPVRADQDIGASIIAEMIERLALSDLVIADMTIPNGNVYYEVGVRHAAAAAGCVMIAADWARPLFDVDQMRQVRYPLPEGAILPETAVAIKNAIVTGAQALKNGVSPVFQALPGYPGQVTLDRATSFKKLLAELSVFRADVAKVGAAPRAQKGALAAALRAAYAGKSAMMSFVALELMYLIRDYVGWQETVDYIGSLPENVRELVVVREQLALARAKAGDDVAAVGALEELVRTLGNSSERAGLIGGRYKNLYAKAKKLGAEAEASRCLDRAIEHYEIGMNLDLNDYYPSSNLPRLFRLRGEGDDLERAQRAATIAQAACERARARNPGDSWVRPTLLGLVFDEGDLKSAQKYALEIKREGPVLWRLETTLGDLERSLASRAAVDSFVGPGSALITELKKLIPTPGAGG